jgi:hypothetical protein
MSGEQPYEITLEATPAPGLRAVLHNRSSVTRTFLHHPDLQPSELILLDGGGQLVHRQDRRANRKFDQTLQSELYRRLRPGEAKPLDEQAFVGPDAGIYGIQWGPFEYPELAPGTYTAQVVWESRRNDWQDEHGQTQRSEDVWLGRVESARVAIRLP